MAAAWWRCWWKVDAGVRKCERAGLEVKTTANGRRAVVHTQHLTGQSGWRARPRPGGGGASSWTGEGRKGPVLFFFLLSPTQRRFTRQLMVWPPMRAVQTARCGEGLGEADGGSMGGMNRKRYLYLCRGRRTLSQRRQSHGNGTHDRTSAKLRPLLNARDELVCRGRVLVALPIASLDPAWV